MEYDRSLWSINTGTPSGTAATSGIPYYNLAPDHLRVLEDECFYLISGVPYTLIQKQLSDFDQLITTESFDSQVVFYAVDDSTIPSQILFWPPPNAAYTVFIRYAKRSSDIASPSSSNTVPIFPLQQYLIWELSARLMDLTDDDRVDKQHAKAAHLLSKWLTMQRDMESTVLRVKLDRNRFSTPYDSLKNTKEVGF
jgi:Zn-dependent M28 family amino/carboxypeptidase